MKKAFILKVFFVFASFNIQAQHSCCTASQAELAFSDLGKDPAFINSHTEPLPFTYEPQFGTMVSLKTDDGKEAKAFEAKVGAGDNKMILLFHEWWGLNDYMKKEAERLALETHHTVLALDLFDGQVTSSKEVAGKLSSSADEKRVMSIIHAGLNYAGKTGKVQTIGWCFGGGWSLQAAIEGSDKVVGCVMYYGMPESDTTRLAQLKAPVLGIFGKKDDFITPVLVEKFAANMRSLNKSIDVEMYDAVHAFANPSNPQHDKAAAADAHKKVVAFINKNFPAPVKPPTQNK